MNFKKRVSKSIALALVGVTTLLPISETVSALEDNSIKHELKLNQKIDIGMDLDMYFDKIGEVINLSNNIIEFDRIRAIEIGLPLEIINNLDVVSNEMNIMIENNQLIIENDDIKINEDVEENINSRVGISVSWTSVIMKYSKAECRKISNALSSGADVLTIVSGLVSISGNAFAGGAAAVIAGVCGISSKIWSSAANKRGLQVTAKVKLPSIKVVFSYKYL